MSSLGCLYDKARVVGGTSNYFTVNFIINDWDKGIDSLGFLSRCCSNDNIGFSIREIASMHYGLSWTVTEDNAKDCSDVLAVFFGFVKMHNGLCDLDIKYNGSAEISKVSNKDNCISVLFEGTYDSDFFDYIVNRSPIVTESVAIV